MATKAATKGSFFSSVLTNWSRPVKVRLWDLGDRFDDIMQHTVQLQVGNADDGEGQERMVEVSVRGKDAQAVLEIVNGLVPEDDEQQ